MAPDTRSKRPSKGEVAFRFATCAAIALALYYTPEIGWNDPARTPKIPQIDAMLQRPTGTLTATACSPAVGTGALADAAFEAN